jgi:hypothetical protein
MGLEEALILLYLLVDDAYRIVTFGGRLRPDAQKFWFSKVRSRISLWREIHTAKLPTQDPVTRSKHDSQKQKRPGDGRHHPGGAEGGMSRLMLQI